MQIHALEESDVSNCPLAGVRFCRDAFNIFVNNWQMPQ
jgi:hypothetical protein